MIQQHWGLSYSPFRGSLDPRLFYRSPTHEEALARLDYLVDEHLRLGLLLGESGVGKSLVLEVFRRSVRSTGSHSAIVNLQGIDLPEMLWSLASHLGVNPPVRATPLELWRALTDRIIENRYQRLSTVLLLDDAGAASREVLGIVRRLAQWDLSCEARLTVVLSLNFQELGRLGNNLLELAELRIDLEAWQPSETVGFLESALAGAGRRRPAFSDSAAALVHQLCEGVPRRVKQLAELALIVGARRQLDPIDVDAIEAAFQEVGVVTTAAN